ncbi:cytochrome c family protein [Desulfatibacillum aliphaticivorans]|uniref:Cytochrome c family protein (Periplasmic) n=1 Tax=Desulfatibacillum aliphaticivorans TaxID=218208 RepID=B8FCK0_DESAL|nr:cytochrome c family protein [Desulfatibacillum aliphaticivorans]ACL06163.1 Cytochrome c family protein (periplasmic) [Desulfatibacillum aliphaticivorans]
MKMKMFTKIAGAAVAGIALAFLVLWPMAKATGGIVGGGYIGSEACKECHAKHYESWSKNSRKAKSWESINRMREDDGDGGLTEEEIKECYQCHTTGYGQETGFVNETETPGLKNVGCEACHGPGRLHTETMEKAHIVKTPTIELCAKCHEQKDEDNIGKVRPFRYKKVIYAGAH